MMKKILASFLLMQELWVPRSASSACSSWKYTERWQGHMVSAAYPQASSVQPDSALHGAAIYPHPEVLGGPCSLHWYWYSVRHTFPGVSHILPDREGKAAPCQHSHAGKGCKASTRKNLGLCQPTLDLLHLILAARYRNGEEACQHPDKTEQGHIF